MKITLKGLFWTYLAIGYGIVAFTFWQTYTNNPYRGCTKFDTDTSWIGYHCQGEDLYTN